MLQKEHKRSISDTRNAIAISLQTQFNSNTSITTFPSFNDRIQPLVIYCRTSCRWRYNSYTLKSLERFPQSKNTAVSHLIWAFFLLRFSKAAIPSLNRSHLNDSEKKLLNSAEVIQSRTLRLVGIEIENECNTKGQEQLKLAIEATKTSSGQIEII